MSITRLFLNFFFPPTIEEQRKIYIEKNGYPDENVILSDWYGRYGCIIGKNTFKRIIDSDWAKHISKEIKEKGYCKL